MFQNHRAKTLLRVALIAVFALCCGACKDSGGDESTPTATLRYEVVGAYDTLNQILLAGGISYTAQVVEGTEWCSFSSITPGQSSVTGPVVPVVFLYLQKNTLPDRRKAVVKVTFPNRSEYELTFYQQGYTPSGIFDKAWAEQPLFDANADYIYKTYYTTLANSQYVRSYSICYDREKKVAHWVAYPLHRVYVNPAISRTDAWAYDPNVQLPVIPESEQQYIVQTYGTGYARGHQCPSADRYSTVDTNKQTFYATNMMPQNGDFNGGVWASLEIKVRDNIVSDTLYVVTGTFFGDSRTMTDRKGTRISVPSNCWKVLLRTRNGKSGKRIQDCTAEELQGIGFWFANNTSNSDNLALHAYSIAEIEAKTGFTFFRNLPQKAASEVKGQKNPSDWKIR